MLRTDVSHRLPLHIGRHHFFYSDIHQDRIVQHGLGKQLLQLGVLVLKRLQLARIGHVHAATLRLAFVEDCIRDAVLAADIDCLRARLRSFNIPMICSSVNRERFIRPSAGCDGLY